MEILDFEKYRLMWSMALCFGLMFFALFFRRIVDYLNKGKKQKRNSDGIKLMEEEDRVRLAFFKDKLGEEVYEFSLITDVFVIRRKKNNRVETCMAPQKLYKYSPWF